MASRIPTKDIEVAKTVLATLFKKEFDSEYEFLFKITNDLVRDIEAAKEILNESFSAVLENAYKMFQANEVIYLFMQQIRESSKAHIKEMQARKEYESQQDHSIEVYNSTEEEIRRAALEAFEKLPEERKKIFFQKLQKRTTNRMVASEIPMDKAVSNYNGYTAQLLRKFFFNKQ